MTLRALYEVPAPAKLNLFLHVVGRRPDGYHLLQSLMLPIDWFDTLHFERRDDARLARHDLGECLPADDLCLRAARALQAASGTAFGVDISIEKRLPTGAGLGGGSSDAATTLVALNRLWRLDWPRARLSRIGLSIGADVPFFLGPGAALVEGIGERLTAVVFAPTPFEVVKPAAGIETGAVFKSPLLVRDGAPLATADILAGFPAGGTASVLQILGSTRNDLQGAAESISAEVGQAADWLRARFGNSRMTGSGSAVFAVADGNVDRQGPDSKGIDAKEIDLKEIDLKEMGTLPREWASRSCTSLAAHPLAGWLRD